MIGGEMKVTVEFDLPEEYDDLRQHLSAPDAVSVLWDIDQHLRGIIKHGPGGHVADALQGVRDLLHQSCSERGVTLD